MSDSRDAVGFEQENERLRERVAELESMAMQHALSESRWEQLRRGLGEFSEGPEIYDEVLLHEGDTGGSRWHMEHERSRLVDIVAESEEVLRLNALLQHRDRQMKALEMLLQHSRSHSDTSEGKIKHTAEAGTQAVHTVASMESQTVNQIESPCQCRDEQYQPSTSEEEVCELRVTLAQHQEHLAEIRQQSEAMEGHVTSLVRDNTILRQRMGDILAESFQMTRERDSLSHKHASDTAQLKKLFAEVRELRHINAVIRGEGEALKQRKGFFQLVNLTEELETVRREEEEAREKAVSSIKHIHALRGEVAALQRRIADRDRAVSDLSEALAKFKRQPVCCRAAQTVEISPQDPPDAYHACGRGLWSARQAYAMMLPTLINSCEANRRNGKID